MIEVDPAQLRKVAGTVEQLSTSVSAAYTAQRPVLAPAAGEGEGWQSAVTARTAQGHWDAFMRQLGADITALGAGMRKAADEYATADQAAARRYRNRMEME